MQTISRSTFTTGTIEDTILPADLLQRIVDGRKMEELLADHERVQDAARIKGISHNIRTQSSVDVLGVYVLLPA